MMFLLGAEQSLCIWEGEAKTEFNLIEAVILRILQCMTKHQCKRAPPLQKDVDKITCKIKPHFHEIAMNPINFFLCFCKVFLLS